MALDFAVGRGHCVLVGSRTSRSEWVASERGDVIYLDHNATTPIAPQVLDAMLPYLTQHYGNPSSEHAFGRRARLAVEEARAHVASLIGAEADEIVFTSGGTEANNLAILGSAATAAPTRRRIVTTSVEHPATTTPCDHLEQQHWTITRTPVGPSGAVDAADLVAALDEDVALLSVMLAQNETGAVMPVAKATTAARHHGVTTHTDAAQAVGKVRVNVAELGVDLLSIAGHKMYAPKGVGALYVRRGLELRPCLTGAGQERGIRPGTENVASIVALGAACEMARLRPAEAMARVARLRDRLWQLLQQQIPGLVRHTPDDSLPNTLNLSFPRSRGADVLARAPRLAASTGSACHSGEDTPSAVLLAMGVTPEAAMGSIRLSLGYGNTASDVDSAVEMLVAAARD